MRPSWLALALVPLGAAAHPYDEVVVAAYLTLAPGEVRLELELLPGQEVAGVLLAELDPDADGAVTGEEARAFADGVLERSALLLDGEPAAWRLGDVVVPPPEVLLLGGDVVVIDAVAARPEASGTHTLGYESRYEPAQSLWMANVFLLPGPAWAYRVTGQERSGDGRRLTVTYEAAPP